jgi:hypothetical protein
MRLNEYCRQIEALAAWAAMADEHTMASVQREQQVAPASGAR